MIYEDFVRAFTEDEFQDIFKSWGYPPIAEDFCRKELNVWYHHVINEEIGNAFSPNDKSVDDIISDIVEQNEWEATTAREEALVKFNRNEDVQTYIEQRNLGFCHEWALVFTTSDDENPYDHAYTDLSGTNEELAQQELERLISILTKGKDAEYKDFLQMALKDVSVDTAIEQYRQFEKDYSELLKQGNDKVYAYKYVEGQILDHYNHKYADMYAKGYVKALNKGRDEDKAESDAYSYAEAFRYLSDEWDDDVCREYADLYMAYIYEGYDPPKAKETAHDLIQEKYN